MPALLRSAAAGLLVIASTQASAWVLTLTPGSKQLFLMVGVGTAAANNPTINTVSVAVPAAGVGSGSAQTMASDGTQSRSPHDNCAQVHGAGHVRRPRGVHADDSPSRAAAGSGLAAGSIRSRDARWTNSSLTLASHAGTAAWGTHNSRVTHTKIRH